MTTPDTTLVVNGTDTPPDLLDALPDGIALGQRR
jgi:hypothetical protein